MSGLHNKYCMCTVSSIWPTVRAPYLLPTDITDNICVTGRNIADEQKSESCFSG